MKLKNVVLIGVVSSIMTYLNNSLETEGDKDTNMEALLDEIKEIVAKKLDEFNIDEQLKELHEDNPEDYYQAKDVAASIADELIKALGDKFKLKSEHETVLEETEEVLAEETTLEVESTEEVEDVQEFVEETVQEETTLEQVLEPSEEVVEELAEEVETEEVEDEVEDTVIDLDEIEDFILNEDDDDFAKFVEEVQNENASLETEEIDQETEETNEETVNEQSELVAALEEIDSHEKMILELEALLEDLNQEEAEETEEVETEVEETTQEETCEEEVQVDDIPAVKELEDFLNQEEAQEEVSEELTEDDYLSQIQAAIDANIDETPEVVEEPTLNKSEIDEDEIDDIFAQIVNTDEEEVKEDAEEVVDELIEDLVEETEEEVEEIEEPLDVYSQINELYPYLSRNFVRAVYDLKEAIASEYPLNSNIIILHRLSFTDLEFLHQFTEIVINHNYRVNVDERQMIVDIIREFKNTDGKILTNIFEIANQAKLLHGEYEGYRVEVID